MDFETAEERGILIGIMTDTLSDKMEQGRHRVKHHLMLLTDPGVKAKGSKLRSLLNKKYRDVLKTLPDIPRKGKAVLFF